MVTVMWMYLALIVFAYGAWLFAIWMGIRNPKLKESKKFNWAVGQLSYLNGVNCGALSVVNDSLVLYRSLIVFFVYGYIKSKKSAELKRMESEKI